MADYDAQGKTCLITGGAAGMGELHVKFFLKEGAKFVAILDINEDKGKTLAETLVKTYPGKVEFFKCDVGDEESVTEVFNSVLERVGHLDIVINNAGMLNERDGWRNTCNVNYLGLVSFCMKAQKHMRKDLGGVGGTIINASSVSAFFMAPTNYIPIYSGTKAAVLHYSRCLAYGSPEAHADYQGGVGGAIINVSSVSAFLTAPSIPIYSGTKGAVLHYSRCLAMAPFSKTGVRVISICFSGTATSFSHGFEHRIDPMNLENISKLCTSQQRIESAAKACMEVFKTGENGSVWISQNDEPAQDITETITKAYDLMQSVIVF